LSILLRRQLALATPALLLAACAQEQAPPPATAAAPHTPAPEPQPVSTQPDARIELRNWQLAFIGQVAWGEGTLIYRGQRKPFRIRSLGAGGVGASRVRATGEVYNMPDVSRFPGVYLQTRAGLALPGAEVPGTIWLQNAAGVRLRLQPRRTGLALQIGADGVLVEMR
jgi:hypothetical protein